MATLFTPIGGLTISLDANLIIYLLIAAVIGVVAEFIIGWRMPFGIVGAVIASLIGIWLMTNVINITGVGDIVVDNVPLIRALVGAMVPIALWHLITHRSWKGRRSYFRR